MAFLYSKILKNYTVVNPIIRAFQPYKIHGKVHSVNPLKNRSKVRRRRVMFEVEPPPCATVSAPQRHGLAL